MLKRRPGIGPGYCQKTVPVVMHSTVAGWTLAVDRSASAYSPHVFRFAPTAARALAVQVAELKPVRFGAGRVRNPTHPVHDAAGGGAPPATGPPPQTLNRTGLFQFDPDRESAESPLAHFLLLSPDKRPVRRLPRLPGGIMDGFSNETAVWLEDRMGAGAGVRVAIGDDTELEIGVLIAAASEWTEDEMELDDLVVGLVESGRVQIQIGSDERID